MYRYSTVFIILFSIVFQSMSIAQNPDKYYTRRVQEGGDIFLVFPNEDFKNKTDRSDFAFDITMREGSDSATINFTYYSKNPLPASKLLIQSGDHLIEAAAEKLYVDPLRKNWEHRFSATMEAGAMIRVFSVQTPPQFIVQSKTGNLVFESRKRKWEKYAEVLDKIFYLVYPEKFD